MILLYTVEALVPILTVQLVWAAAMAMRKEKERHRRMAIIHAASVWGSYILVWVMMLMGHAFKGTAAKWIVDIHQVIIYLLPALLLVQAPTGLKGVRWVHIPLGVTYVILWVAALVTGAMIFLSARGYM